LATARGLITDGVFVSRSSTEKTSGSPEAAVQVTTTVPFFHPFASGPVIDNAEMAVVATREKAAAKKSILGERRNDRWAGGGRLRLNPRAR